MDSITRSLSTDFDIPDSASTTSSTLVLTPHSGQNISKWHVDRVFSSPGSSVVDNSTTYKPSPAPKPSQPPPPTLRLLALRTNPNRDPMFQNHGKGPVQPHFNNLPRRRPGPPRNPPKAINKSSRRQERIVTSSSSDSSSSQPKLRNQTLSPQSYDRSSATGVADSASVNSTRYDSSPSSSPHRPPSPSQSNASSQSHAAQHSQRSQPLDHVSDHGRGPLSPIKHDHDHHQRTRSGSYDHIPGRLNQIHLNNHINHVKAYYYAPSSSPSIIAANRLLNQPLFDANVNFNVNNKESSSVTLNDDQPPSASKGHVQPHVSNIPRRRTRGRGRARDGTFVENSEGEMGIIKEENGHQKGHTKVETIQSPEEKKAKRRREWEEERCFEEICRGSGIWVGFSKAVITMNGWVRVKEAKRSNFLDMDTDSEGSPLEKDSEWQKEQVSDAHVSVMEAKIEKENEEEEFVEGASERVIRICLGEGAVDEEVKGDEGFGYSEVVEREGRVLKLCIPGPPERLCDEGVPHLTRKQVEAVRVFLNDDESNSMESIPNPAPESSSSSSSASSTLVSPTPYPERQLRRVCILVPSECAIDAVALGVLLCLGLSRSPSQSQSHPQTPPSLPSLSISQKESLQAIENLSNSRVLAFLSRLHDVDNLQLAWRGCFSCDGIEWLESLLMGKGSAEEKEGQGVDS